MASVASRQPKAAWARGAIVAGDGEVTVYPELCHWCGVCVRACPEESLTEDLAVGGRGGAPGAMMTLDAQAPLPARAMRAEAAAPPPPEPVPAPEPDESMLGGAGEKVATAPTRGGGTYVGGRECARSAR